MDGAPVTPSSLPLPAPTWRSKLAHLCTRTHTHGCVHVHTLVHTHAHGCRPAPAGTLQGSRGTGTWAVLRTPGPTVLLCDPSRLHGFSGLGSSGVRSGGWQAPGGGMPSAKHSAAPLGPWGRAAPLEWKGRAGVQAGAAMSWDSGWHQASPCLLPHAALRLQGCTCPWPALTLSLRAGWGQTGGVHLRPSIKSPVIAVS